MRICPDFGMLLAGLYMIVLWVAVYSGVLLETGIAHVVSGFFAVFWGSRVAVQLICYDAVLSRGDQFWDTFFLLVFVGLILIFTLVLL